MGAVGIYCRISKDREGRAEGIETQERRSREYAAERWPGQPIVVFSDNDLTAADPEVQRPGFDALVAAVRRGGIDQIVCAEQSRLTRIPEVWEQLVITLTLAGITQVHTYRKGVVEFGRSKLVGRILAAVDAEEVEVLRARVAERMEATASEGRPHGGTPFAYRRTLDNGRKHLEPDPDRATVVTETADRLLAGWSLTAVADDLNARAVPTARGGKRWTASSVRSMVTNPTVAGLRTHRGRLTPGTWEPVIPEDTWRALQHLLTAPVVLSTSNGVYRATRSRQAARRRYLLTGGIAVCGLCGAPLAGQQRQRRDGTRIPIYACHPATGGCSRVGIVAAPLEEHVAELLCAELDRPGFWDAYTADPGERSALLAKLGAVAEREADGARRWASGDLKPHEWDAARAVLSEERAGIEARLAALPPAVVPVSGALLREGWDRMGLHGRRGVVVRHVESVTVTTARRGARSFDRDRVQVIFR